jgi:uncharacterized SAM-dependent methyltransferase
MDKLGDNKKGSGEMEKPPKNLKTRKLSFVANDSCNPDKKKTNDNNESDFVPLLPQEQVSSDVLASILIEMQTITATDVKQASQDLFKSEQEKKITENHVHKILITRFENILSLFKDPADKIKQEQIYNLFLDLIQNIIPLEAGHHFDHISKIVFINKKDITDALSNVKQYYLNSFSEKLINNLQSQQFNDSEELTQNINLFAKWFPLKFLQNLPSSFVKKPKKNEIHHIVSKINDLFNEFSNNTHESLDIQSTLVNILQLGLDSQNLEKFNTALDTRITLLSAAQSKSYADVMLDFDQMTDVEMIIPETIMSIQQNRLAPPLLYHDEEPWEAVCEYSKENKTYTALNTGLEILHNAIPNIVDILAPKKDQKINYIDLGTGTGEKTSAICRLLNKSGYPVNLKAVDSSYKILRSSLSNIASDILKEEILNKKTEDIDGNNPWYELIKFVNEANATFSTNARYWVGKVNKIIKNSIKPGWEKEWLTTWLNNWLNTQNLILEEEFEDVLQKIIDANGNFVTIKCQGNVDIKIPVKYPPDLLKHVMTRMLSIHKGSGQGRELIDRLDNDVNLPLKYAPFANKFDDLPQDFIGENPLSNPTLITDLGCRICNTHPTEDTLDLYSNLLPQPLVPDELKNSSIDTLEDEQQIKTPYILVGFQASHTEKGDPKFEEEKNKIEAGYNQDVFLNFVTAPLKRPGIIDYNNGNLNNVGFVKTAYEDDPQYPNWYRIAHKFIFTEDAKITVKGKRTAILNKQKGDSILLHISYKPKVDQMKKMFNEAGFQVVADYFDNDEKPGYAKFLIRKMTKYELVEFNDKNSQLNAKSKSKNVRELKFIRPDSKQPKMSYVLEEKIK